MGRFLIYWFAERIADLAADRWGWAGDSRRDCVAKRSARALVSALRRVTHELGGCRQRDKFAQSAAPHPSPTGTGRGEGCGAVCVSSLDIV